MQSLPLVSRTAQAIQETPRGDLAVMLTGGGARAAYQAGCIKGLARHFPHLQIQIITGVSAGAINAMFLAARRGSLAQKADELAEMWGELHCSNIWHFSLKSLIPFRSALASVFWRKKWSRPHGVVDTAPLTELLYRIYDGEPGKAIKGVKDNLEEGWLKAVALMTMNYSTGQSVRWFQGRDIEMWSGANRRSVAAELTVEHVMASSALPFLFPAIEIGREWHGDGGIRLASPLSPAVHLGATRIIAMSTGYQRTVEEANAPDVTGYPPAAQIMGQLMNAVFLDVIDEDVARLQRMNELLRNTPVQDRGGFKPIELLVLRPTIDPGKLAAEYEEHLPRDLKLLTRAMGAKETDSADFVSLLMFEPHYTRRLIEAGEADVASRLGEIRQFLGEPMPHAVGL